VDVGGDRHPELISQDAGGTHTEVPASVIVAFFAAIGTLFVAIFGFRGGEARASAPEAPTDDERRRRAELEAEVERLRAEVARLSEAADLAVVSGPN
jgi:hypothetical protein